MSCNPCTDLEWEAERKREENECEKIKSTPITVDGFNLTIGDIFPDRWNAKEFYSKLELLRKGREAAGKPTKPSLEDQMYGGAE